MIPFGKLFRCVCGIAAVALVTGTVAMDRARAQDAAPDEAAAVALGLKDAPEGARFEAEAYAGGDVVADAGASGGKAVRSDKKWQTLVRLPLPAGEAFKVWVRHKGGPFRVRTTGGDRWFRQKPAQYEWRETDVFSRDELQGTLTLTRDDSAVRPDSVSIDCVVLQPAAKRELPPVLPDPALPARKVTASVDWGKSVGAVPPMAWGINEREVMTGDGATPEFQKLLGALDVPLIRIHHGSSQDLWTTEATRDWNVEKMKSGFAKSTGYGDVRLMVNVSRWPRWISTSKVLEPEKVDEFARLMGRLVKVFRDDLKRPVAYWEILNERERDYEKAGKMDELWRLYNRCAAEMRKADPNAKLGGPALSYAKPSWVEGFLTNCPDAQFFTYHAYATGNRYESNESVLAKAKTNLGDSGREVVNLVRKHDNGRHLEVFVTEYNIKYTWDPIERRHQHSVGSVFHALSVKRVSLAGLMGACIWQERATAYGSLIGSKDLLYPSYRLFQWGTRYLTGTIAASESSDETLVELFPVIDAKGGKAVLVVNRANHDVVLPPARTLLPDYRTAQQINAEATVDDLKVGADELRVPGYSLTLLAR